MFSVAVEVKKNTQVKCHSFFCICRKNVFKEVFCVMTIQHLNSTQGQDGKIINKMLFYMHVSVFSLSSTKNLWQRWIKLLYYSGRIISLFCSITAWHSLFHLGLCNRLARIHRFNARLLHRLVRLLRLQRRCCCCCCCSSRHIQLKNTTMITLNVVKKETCERN